MIGLWIGKLAVWLLRKTGRNATSFPGKIAMRFSPRILAKLGQQLERCIVITGTNGKTTSTSLLAGMLRQNEHIVTNAEGANLQQGLISALILETNWLGRLHTKTALLEIDEATLPLVAASLPIRVIAVTNVFRDQLDRYGELDTTLQKIIEGIRCTTAVVLLNGDDPLARHIGLSVPNSVHYFGLHLDARSTPIRNQIRDGAFCLACGHALTYDHYIYGQLGYYHCTHCEFERPYPDFLGHYQNGKLELRQGQLSSVWFTLPIRGLFNVYNVLTAVTAARVCGLDYTAIVHGLECFHAPLGRMQVFKTDPQTTLNLIKNPTGCDTVIDAICSDTENKVICIGINDLDADGRDVSWLWDADFEWLVETGNVHTIITTGLRAEDMALRLKYTGYEEPRIVIHPDLSLALTDTIAIAREQRIEQVYVLCTYTLLYQTADILKQGEVHLRHEATAHRTSVS